MAFQLIPRAEPSRAMQLFMPLVVTVATLLAGFLIFMVLGVNIADAFRAYFIEPLSSINGISELLLKALPLCLIGLGLSLAYRANVWNIGAEGQLVVGGIAATWVMVQFNASMTGALLPLMLIAGALGGAAWAGLAAWMRTKFNANEILTTLNAGVCGAKLVAIFAGWHGRCARRSARSDGQWFSAVAAVSRARIDAAIESVFLMGLRARVCMWGFLFCCLLCLRFGW